LKSDAWFGRLGWFVLFWIGGVLFVEAIGLGIKLMLGQ
jgi:hypothetical protein